MALRLHMRSPARYLPGPQQVRGKSTAGRRPGHVPPVECEVFVRGRSSREVARSTGAHHQLGLLAGRPIPPADLTARLASTMGGEQVPDDAVLSAIAHWEPRFSAQGVDPADFARVTGGIERWGDWRGGWSANGNMHAGVAPEAEDRG